MEVIILAGGEGKRLFPLSTPKRPKPFHHFGSKRSSFQEVVKLFYNVPFVSKIVVVAAEKDKKLVQRELLPFLGCALVHTLFEPIQKNTTASIALALTFLEENNKGFSENVLVVPSDQKIYPEKVFMQALQEIERAKFCSEIVLFGVLPKSASTQYGYIKRGEQLFSISIVTTQSLFSIKNFEEKPSKERVQSYLLSKDSFWNMGIFYFSPKIFWQELKNFEFSLFSLCKRGFFSLIERFDEITTSSFDRAIVEKTTKKILFPLEADFFDLGSWEGVFRYLKEIDGEREVGKKSKKDREKKKPSFTKPFVQMESEKCAIATIEKRENYLLSLITIEKGGYISLRGKILTKWWWIVEGDGVFSIDERKKKLIEGSFSTLCGFLRIVLEKTSKRIKIVQLEGRK